MILHDQRFEELAQAPIKQVDVVVARKISTFVEGEEEVIVDDATATWSSGTLLMEVQIDAVGEMLGAATKKATVKLRGLVDTAVVEDLFQVRVGISDSVTGFFNYISEGYFRVDTIDYDYEAGSTTIVMYDAMWRAGNTLYTEAVGLDFIEYPITVENFANTIAGILDVTVGDGFSDLPNSQYEIQEDLYSTISTATLKNVIQDIAGATGTTARMTDQVLNFSSFEPLDETLTSNELKTLKISETYGPITSVVLGRVPQADNVAQNATAPSANLIESIDPVTNLFTLTDHGMKDGNMIRLETTGTLPVPLGANGNYYVYTNGSTDTFALAPTFLDAVGTTDIDGNVVTAGGTNLIDIETVGTGDITIPTLPTREIQINNNEILDDDRQYLLPPLYNVLSGIDWTDVRADTVGLGWHEVGDVFHFQQGGITVRAFLSEIHITLTPGIKEQYISKVPDVAAINYAAAGGITKTIYNTEIKVDKQGQEITSVVSRQETLEGVVNQQFSEISQDVDDVLITIQRAGGGNILYNSVGFAKESFRDANNMSYDKLLYWTYPEPYDIATNGTATSYSSSDSQSAGGISGQVIELTGDMTISQRVTVAAGIPLTFAVRANNVIGTGSATIYIENDVDSWKLEIDDLQSYDWKEFNEVLPSSTPSPQVPPTPDPLISTAGQLVHGTDSYKRVEGFKTFVSSLPWLNVTIVANNAQRMALTDLRLMYGSTTQGWVQANGEILSANVQFTTDGVRVFDSVHDTETRMTYNEFSTRRKTDNEVLFEADDLGITTGNLAIKGRTSYIRDGDTIIKQITVGASNPKAGLAFIKVVE